jgi:hypothetical protein
MRWAACGEILGKANGTVVPALAERDPTKVSACRIGRRPGIRGQRSEP